MVAAYKGGMKMIQTTIQRKKISLRVITMTVGQIAMKKMMIVK